MKIKTGLWKKQSKKGTNYYSGKVVIEDKEYNLAIFKNNKEKDTQPDLMLYIEEKEKEKKSLTIDEVVYSDFGKDIENIKDEDLAF